MENILLEACVESFDQAILAEQQGAHRIELCARLVDGGLTPEPDLVTALLSKLHIPIKVMIRPRAGNFIYTEAEINQMVMDILHFKKMGIQEVVLGVLNEHGAVHLEQMRILAKAAAPMAITFHKAIDETADPLKELERMCDLPENVKYILSSGKKPTAQQGYLFLRTMVEKFRHRFIIIAAGKITDKNLADVHQLVCAREYHGRKIVGELSL